MHPTLQRLDMLDVEALDCRAVHAGDVIVFSPGHGCAPDSYIVHRVRRCLSIGFVTQGDSCTSPDTEPVRPGQVLGRVRGVLRNGRRHRVWGGRAGLLWLQWVRVRRAGVWLATALYRRLGRSIWRGWRPRVVRVRVQTPEGVLVKFVSGGRTVGECQPQRGSFWCRKPYDLAIGPPQEEQP